MKIYPFNAIYPNETLVTSSDSFFGSMKQDYPEFVKAGFFQTLDKKGIYIYTIKTPNREFVALVASNDLDDIRNNKILKHEETLAAKEQSMMQLILQRNAMIKPVLLAYEGCDNINEFITSELNASDPLLELTFEETSEYHCVYPIYGEKKISKLQRLFKDHVKKCYIADGHHRVSTTMILSQGDHLPNHQLNSLLCIYFPFKELEIYDYNRSIQIRGDVPDTLLMARLSKVMKIKELPEPLKPSRKHEITMYLDDRWYRLRWKNKVINKYRGKNLILDTELLNRYILKKIMRISDIRTNNRVKYIAGTLGCEEVMRLSQGEQRRVGFCLFPISKNELKYVANNGLNLPPKSTWFEPRIKNGVISQDLA